jgi:ceramide glucosyltransferase
VSVYAFGLWAAAAIGTAYALLALALAVAASVRSPEPEPAPSSLPHPLPSVSVLRPLSGVDPGLEGRLLALKDQRYPGPWELVLGVSDPADPALAVARRVAARIGVRTAVRSRHVPLGANPKVNNLAGMLQEARGTVLVVGDDDVVAPPHYLTALVRCLEEPGVGLVTCLYRAHPLRGLWSRMLAAYVNGWFVPSVRVGSLGRSSSYTFGATYALTRSTLEAVGGLKALAPYLADDFVLGQRVEQIGLRVRLAPVTVETMVHEPSLLSLVHHELRWLRTIRVSRPWGYAFSFLTYPIALSLVNLAAQPNGSSVGLLAVAVAVRSLLLRVEERHLGAHRTPLWLVPVVDVFTFTLWVWGWLSRQVVWRGRRYALGPQGRLLPLPREVWPQARSAGG